ncbi:MAG: electron transfer flavoprotein subunit alpha/FixB family protein [Cyclobacteriaceae bacterium]|nr:electron transfer flavoprotein subunit alpha/FixB family protein [Cyclobacteriaceae bacterium]
MSIIVVIDSADGSIKKASREAVSYASQIGGDVIALSLGDAPESELASLGKNGASKVISVAGEFNSIQEAATAVSEIMTGNGAEMLVFAQSAKASAIGGRVAVKQGASMASNVVALPDTTSGFSVKTSIFSGKAFANVALNRDKKILVVNKNTVEIKEDGGDAAVETGSVNIPDSDKNIAVTGQEKASGDILLTDADIVVSAGRGLKGPENWTMIEDLAKALGAATGCSKPVSDMDWRPHSEHVGQTGIKVAPTLYIAVGISGAIQHLAGVNSSKYIVVINTNEDAPFFKAADYGIVGDAFEVIPKLTEAIKAL